MLGIVGGDVNSRDFASYLSVRVLRRFRGLKRRRETARNMRVCKNGKSFLPQNVPNHLVSAPSFFLREKGGFFTENPAHKGYVII